MFRSSKNVKKLECLKCKYDKLIQEGKEIFDRWDQKGKPPKRLVVIQKKLIKLKKEIKKQKVDEEYQFCAKHPEIFEFLPSEWT